MMLSEYKSACIGFHYSMQVHKLRAQLSLSYVSCKSKFRWSSPTDQLKASCSLLYE